ncbi:alpha/beta fold hydrolase [Nocardia sp. JMUB6875]|uniref:alpha/beta fold hydrolase n=1 Tax=Nocardia sp. JMUB6875 TaxID=3158170 RepID=UPI0032E752B2
MSDRASTQSQQRVLRIERAGTTLSARIRDGEGLPVVLVPGVMADAATWQDVVDHIELPNPVVTVNRRGRLPSGPLGDDYSVRVEIDDLHRILDEIGGEAHLFGWSYGGLIALETAVERPTIRSLTAYEPVTRPFAPSAIEPLRNALAHNDFDRVVELVNTEISGFSSDYVSDLRRSPAWPVLRSLSAPVAAELAAINDYPPHLESYRDLTIPVTLLLGELNENLPPYGTAFATIAAALPQASVIRIPEQGHLAHASAPQLLAQHLTAAITAASQPDPLGLSCGR